MTSVETMRKVRRSIFIWHNRESVSKCINRIRLSSGQVIIMDFKNLANAALSATGGAGKMDLPLSGASMGNLTDLIGKGVFKDKGDFIQFVIKAYMEYKTSGGSAQPTQGDVKNIIQNTGVGSNLNGSDIDGKLVPLLTEAFQMAGKTKIGL